MTSLVKINTITKSQQISRINQIVPIIFILFVISPGFCNSQDIYNMEQSEKYAGYLFSSQQYELAAEEFERLVYLDGNNTDYKDKLIKSYRLSGDLNKGLNRINSFYGISINTMPPALAKEYIRFNILSDSIIAVESFISSSNTLSINDKAVSQSCVLLLNGKYAEAGLFVNTSLEANLPLPSSLISITRKAEQVKYKSPFISAGLSAIIPGTGKFYTKNWSDGIISMIFVASNAWQAYRGFHEKGVKSIYGWTFASLSASFYIGNIFGSAKAARRYNTVKKNEIDNQIFEFVSSDNF